MSTQLPPSRHLEGLRSAMVAFVRYADRAGLDAPVPTCPGWTVRDLVAHLGAAHRATARMVRGEEPMQPVPMTGDPVEWLRDGAIELVEAITRRPHDLWARRACHQTTIRAVDALAAVFGRPADAAETWIEDALAADGIDEVLTRTASRAGSRLRGDVDGLLMVAPGDVLDWWLVRVGPDPGVVRHGHGSRPDVPAADWELGGTAVGLYLAMWDRSARPLDVTTVAG